MNITRAIPFYRPLGTSTIINAGHSHWRNVKSIKEGQDAIKSKVTGHITMRIFSAVQRGGPDPKYNPDLENLLERAKASCISMKTIEACIKNAHSTKTVLQQIQRVETIGDGGYILVIEGNTRSREMLIGDINRVIKKFGMSIVREGSVLHQFNTKGVVRIKDTFHPVDFDLSNYPSSEIVEKIEELAIETNAEDVSFSVSPFYDRIIEFICGMNYHKNVADLLKKSTLAQSIDIISSSNEFIPHSLIELTDEKMQKADRVIKMINNVDSVTDVYENIKYFPSIHCKIYRND